MSAGLSGYPKDRLQNRYREPGLDALTDRSRRPWRYANQLPAQVETLTARRSTTQTFSPVRGLE